MLQKFVSVTSSWVQGSQVCNCREFFGQGVQAVPDPLLPLLPLLPRLASPLPNANISSKLLPGEGRTEGEGQTEGGDQQKEGTDKGERKTEGSPG